jgi:hypothetical protein
MDRSVRAAERTVDFSETLLIEVGAEEAADARLDAEDGLRGVALEVGYVTAQSEQRVYTP